MWFALTIAADAMPEGWIEKHEFPDAMTIAEATILGLAMVQRFNATLRPGEQPRRLLKIEVTESEPDPYREMLENSCFSDCPEGCCPACWGLNKEEVRMEYNQRWDQDVCPECGYT